MRNLFLQPADNPRPTIPQRIAALKVTMDAIEVLGDIEMSPELKMSIHMMLAQQIGAMTQVLIATADIPKSTTD